MDSLYIILDVLPIGNVLRKDEKSMKKRGVRRKKGTSGQKTDKKQDFLLTSFPDGCILRTSSQQTFDGEEYLLTGAEQGVAESGTAMRTAGANGLRRVCPSSTGWVGQNGRLHPLPRQRVSCLYATERVRESRTKLSGTAGRPPQFEKSRIGAFFDSKFYG